MKKIMILMCLMLITLVACEKSEPFFEIQENDYTTIRSELSTHYDDCTNLKTVPLKGEIIETADLSLPPVYCGPIPYPRRWLDIKGTLTHFGNVEGGYANILSCDFEFPRFTAGIEGVFQAANGDIVNYRGYLWFLATDPTVGGSEFEIYDGTGKWEGAKGCFDATFTRLDDLSIIFRVDGHLTPPGALK